MLTKVNRSFTRHNLLMEEITKRSYKFNIVRQDSKMAECIGLNQTIYEYDKKAKSAEDYFVIAKELIAEEVTHGSEER